MKEIENENNDDNTVNLQEYNGFKEEEEGLTQIQ